MKSALVACRDDILNCTHMKMIESISWKRLYSNRHTWSFGRFEEESS